MAKQTFTTGQVLTAAQMTDLQQTAMTGGAASTKTVSYVLVAADAGTRVAMNAAGSTTITVNTGLFSAGDTVSIQNIGAGVCTVTAGTATVNTSGSLVLAQYQGGILYFTSASAAIFFQFATPASGDIEGVTAGTGISGGGTSGTVTITNSMATAIDAKGDLVAGTGADTFARLAVGANDTVLTAASGEATGLKWAAPAATGSNWSLLNSGGTALTAATTITISSISGRDSILILITGASAVNASQAFSFRINGDTGSNYTNYFVENSVLSPYNPQFIYSASETTDKINVAATSNNAACAVNGYILISGCNAAGVKTFTGAAGTDFGGASPTGGSQRFYGGIYTGTSTVSSVSVVTTGSNFDAGTVYVYATNQEIK